MHIWRVETLNSDNTPYFYRLIVFDITNALDPSVVSRGTPNASILLGGTPEEQALVEQWTHFADTEVHVFNVLLYLLFAHKVPYSKPVRT